MTVLEITQRIHGVVNVKLELNVYKDLQPFSNKRNDNNVRISPGRILIVRSIWKITQGVVNEDLFWLS